MSDMEQIYLSPPHLSGHEEKALEAALASNWIAPVGPELDAFEREIATRCDVDHALATSTGTAALHLALRVLGVGPGDVVPVSTLTFIASVSPIIYQGATPLFIDSERASWNLDPDLLETALDEVLATGRRVPAIVVVHLYGQCADMERIVEICAERDVAVVEDAAEALGATYRGRAAGSMGRLGIFSFNGNKIITTSNGGMLVSDDEALIERARRLATQARKPAPHYEHLEVGYNYRMSNLLAAVGRAQLGALDERVAARRRVFEAYRAALGDLPGISFMPEAAWGGHTRWLTCMTVDPDRFGRDREDLRLELEARKIEARPVWKPMHRQPALLGHDVYGGGVAEEIFQKGLCLPSGSALEPSDLDRVVEVFHT